MKKINIYTLSRLLTQELIAKAKEIGLSKYDLFVLTLKEEIEETTKSYRLAEIAGEGLDLRDYVRKVKDRIHYGLLFVFEDFSFTT